jgi:hypothetical protein
LLDGPVVGAGAFDGHDQVPDVMLLHGLANAVEGRAQVALGVGHGRGGQQHPAKEVGEQVTGAGLGAVDGDDAEVLRTDGLDPLAEVAFERE